MKVRDLPLKSPADGTEKLIVVDATGNAKRVAVSDVREALEGNPTYSSIGDAIADPASNLNVVGNDLRTGGKIAGVFAKLTEINGVYAIRDAVSSVYANVAKVVAVANDLLLGAASKIAIVAADLALGASSLIGQAITAASTATTKAGEAAASAANLGAAVEVFPKLLAKDTATAASFTASTGATVAISGTNLTLNVPTGYAWATVNDTSYDAIDFTDPGAFGRFVTIGPWIADTSKMIVLDLGSSLGAVGNITTAGVYGGMASVPVGGNTATATNDVGRIIKRGTIWSFLIQRGGTGAYVDYIPPIDTSTWTATPRFGFALISGIGSAQAVAGKVTLLKTGYDNVVANVATNTSDIAGIKSSTSGLIEVAPLLLSKRALATGDLTLVNATPTIGGANNALTLTVPTGQRGYAAFPTGSFRQFTIKLTTASQYMLLGANADGSFVGFSPTDSTYSRYQFTTAGGLTAALGGALPGNTGKTVAAIGDTIRQTLYDGFIYFEIDRGSTGTYAAWLTPFRAGDAYASVLLGMAAPGGSTIVCSGVTVALPGLADLTAQVADNTTNSARVALGGQRLVRRDDFSYVQGQTVTVENGRLVLGRSPAGGSTIAAAMLDTNIRRVEFQPGPETFYGIAIGRNAGDGNITMMGLGPSVQTLFDCSLTTSLINQTGVDLGVYKWRENPAPISINGTDMLAAERLEDGDTILFEYRRGAASFTGRVDPAATFTGTLTSSNTTNSTLTVDNPGTATFAVGTVFEGEGFPRTRITAVLGGNQYTVIPGAQKITSRAMRVPPLLWVTAVASGSLDTGVVLNTGVAAGTTILERGSATLGQTGSYVLNIDQTVAAGTAMTSIAQTGWNNSWRLNRKMAVQASATNLTGWDTGLQLGFMHFAGSTVACASNITVLRRKTVTIDGYDRDGLDYRLAELERRINRGLPYKGEPGGFIGDSITAASDNFRDAWGDIAARRMELSSYATHGFGGYTTIQIHAMLESFTTGHRIIYIRAGVNDYLIPPQTPLGTAGVDARVRSVGWISGNTLTVTSGGPHAVGDYIVGTGVRPYTKITSGSAGVFTVDGAAQTVASTNLLSVRDTYSAMISLIDELGRRNPRARIVVITPTQVTGYTLAGGSAPNYGTTGTNSLLQYVDIIIAAAQSQGVKVADWYRGGPYSQRNGAEHLYDLLHPQQWGHWIAGNEAASLVGS